MPKGLKIVLIISGILVVSNLVFVDWQLFWGGKWIAGWMVKVGKEAETKEEEKIATDSCGLVCQQTIEEKIQNELARLPSPAGQSSVSPSQSPYVLPKAPKTTSGEPRAVYVPLTTDGSATSVSWVDVIPSEFYFDLGDYPAAKQVRFQAYLLSSNNDVVYARLYDQTNNRGVDYSDIQTTSSTFTRVESSGMTIWRGNNKYIIQLRSVNGTLVQLKDAKLKIIY